MILKNSFILHQFWVYDAMIRRKKIPTQKNSVRRYIYTHIYIQTHNPEHLKILDMQSCNSQTHCEFLNVCNYEHIHMYIYLFICSYVYLYTCIYVCKQEYIHICVYVYIYMYTCIHIHILIDIYIDIYIHAYICINIYICIYV